MVAEMTQQQIGDEVGVPRESVRDIINKFGENGKISNIAKSFSPFIYDGRDAEGNNSERRNKA